MWNDTPKDGFSDTPQSKLVGVGRVAFALVVGLSSCGSSVTKAIGTSAPPGTVAAAISSSPTSAPVATTLAAPVATPPLSAPAAVAPAPVAPEAAVAGDIPDTQAFVTYTPPVGGFSIKVPEGWARSSDGTATLFTDKYNTIRVETVAMAAAPTVESVTKADVPVLAAATKGFKPGKVSVVARNAGSAILAVYSQDSLPNAVTGKSIQLAVERYEFWKAGSALVVTLSSAAGSDNVDPWKTVTDGLAWA